jgi:hypothetical protein
MENLFNTRCTSDFGLRGKLKMIILDLDQRKRNSNSHGQVVASFICGTLWKCEFQVSLSAILLGWCKERVLYDFSE